MIYNCGLLDFFKRDGRSEKVALSFFLLHCGCRNQGTLKFISMKITTTKRQDLSEEKLQPAAPLIEAKSKISEINITASLSQLFMQRSY